MERPYSLVYLIINAASVFLMNFDVHVRETMSLKEYTHRRNMLSVRKTWDIWKFNTCRLPPRSIIVYED